MPSTISMLVRGSMFAAVLLLVSVSEASNDQILEAQRQFLEFAQSSGSPGLSISVGSNGQVIWSAGFGHADVEQQVPVDPAITRFRIGSVAKPMTALALAMLASSGQLDIDADVRSHVPNFPQKEHGFSTRQLAGHLAGIRHYASGEAYSRERYSSVTESLRIFQDDPLVAVPGTEWRYSSYGYNLLSAVIEQASGKEFLDFLHESVFSPIAMTATVPDHLDEIIPHRGRYYYRRDGVLLNEPEVDNSNKWASGGILSTTDDLARFGLAHFNDDFVSEAMRVLLWTEQSTVDGGGTGYAIGWRIVEDDAGNLWIGHGGGSIGGTTQLWLFPDSGLVIAMASNQTVLDYGDILPRLRSVFLGSSE